MLSRRWGWLYGVVVAFTSAIIFACAHSAVNSAAVVAEAPQQAIAVTVDNQTFYDFDVYVLTADGGLVRHIGTVTSTSKLQFMLSGTLVRGSQHFRLYARSRLAGIEMHSEDFTVYAGLGLQWTLERPGASWLSVYQLRTATQ